jgi:hypothetical protein
MVAPIIAALIIGILGRDFDAGLQAFAIVLCIEIAGLGFFFLRIIGAV